MAGSSENEIREALDPLYRAESGRILATLIRLLGDFDLAEDALHDSFAAALGQWPRYGVPANPRGWLVSTGRFKAIDALRRRARFDASQEGIADLLQAQGNEAGDEEGVGDDRLRLIFTCCHPALTPEARVALTLREVCGLTTEEIAHAFLTAVPALAQRIVRAKAKIREARIPYQVPTPAELPERIDTVLQVVYLVFNEGYSASSGSAVTRGELTEYHLAYSARADLCRRLGKAAEARLAYQKALALTQLEPERRFLEKRLREVGWKSAGRLSKS